MSQQVAEHFSAGNKNYIIIEYIIHTARKIVYKLFAVNVQCQER